jgi:hypothetical protein
MMVVMMMMVLMMVVMMVMAPGDGCDNGVGCDDGGDINNGDGNFGSDDINDGDFGNNMFMITSFTCSWLKRLRQRKQKERKWKGKNIYDYCLIHYYV